MGDRTTVTVIVLTSQAEQAKAEIEVDQGLPSEEGVYDFDAGTTFLQYEEVNYGVIYALDNFTDLGIPVSSSWNSGADFTEGGTHLRFTPEGTAVLTSSAKDWPYNTLVNLKEASRDCSTFDEMIQLFDQAIAGACSPGWENQEENAKRYLAVQLITPKEAPQC